MHISRGNEKTCINQFQKTAKSMANDKVKASNLKKKKKKS
jgi:hypothetical protein